MQERQVTVTIEHKGSFLSNSVAVTMTLEVRHVNKLVAPVMDLVSC